MPNRRSLALLLGAITIVAVACGGDSTTAPTGTLPSTGTGSAATETRVPPIQQQLAPDPLLEVPPTPRPLDWSNRTLITNKRCGQPGSPSSVGPRISVTTPCPTVIFLSGGPPRDGIRPLDSPIFETIDDAGQWLSDKEPVISFEINGDQRAYPLQVLIWHEVVNDAVGGVPVTITFCPLCNSAIVFERTVNGMVLTFGTSGNLRNSDLVMWDRQTESWWQQLTGESLVGVLAGTKLTFLPAPIVSWQDFRTHQPDGIVLSKDTGFDRRYGQNPYVGYDQVDIAPFLYTGDLDGRLQPKERVAAITVDGVDAAFPFSTLAQEGTVNYQVIGVDVAVLFKSGTASALDGSLIGSSRDIGSAAVFNAVLDGQKLTFSATDDGFTDAETGSTWNILGEAIDGPLTGERLTKIVHGDDFWFAWGAFKPDTLIYQGQG